MKKLTTKEILLKIGITTIVICVFLFLITRCIETHMELTHLEGFMWAFTIIFIFTLVGTFLSFILEERLMVAIFANAILSMVTLVFVMLIFDALSKFSLQGTGVFIMLMTFVIWVLFAYVLEKFISKKTKSNSFSGLLTTCFLFESLIIFLFILLTPMYVSGT